MKIDQIAFYAHNELQVNRIKRQFGLLNAKWVEDTVDGHCIVLREDFGYQHGISTANLMFNYDLGVELEILTYTDGPHWHDQGERFKSGDSFFSHIGIHMKDEDEHEPFQNHDIVQEMHTTKHTNPYLLERNRKYHYVIRDTRALLGCYTKYIWRKEPKQELPKARSGADILADASNTYRARNAVYGDNFLKVGKIMETLFPDGITLKTADDHNRFHIFMLGVVKQTRYVHNWPSGGHSDSSHDLTVYSAMLEAIDAEIAGRKS